MKMESKLIFQAVATEIIAPMSLFSKAPWIDYFVWSA
jgi:hypothetical protein